MIESEINIFMSCLENYFVKKLGAKATIESPYLIEEVGIHLLDYTGVISISGAYLGNIYFTATSPFAELIVLAHNQEPSLDEIKSDAVGEIVNTLSGNSRKELGGDFVISVPKMVESEDCNELEDISETHAYIIPIVWKEQRSALIISIIKN